MSLVPWTGLSLLLSKALSLDLPSLWGCRPNRGSQAFSLIFRLPSYLDCKQWVQICSGTGPLSSESPSIAIGISLRCWPTNQRKHSPKLPDNFEACKDPGLARRQDHTYLIWLAFEKWLCLISPRQGTSWLWLCSTYISAFSMFCFVLFF